MSKLGYKITSVLICDQIRREDNGKEIIIGVYRDVIIVPSLPCTMPSITFRVSATLEHTNFKTMRLSVIGPTRHKYFEYESDISILEVDEPLIVISASTAPKISEAGVYTIKVSLDGPLRKIGQFSVRLPQSDSEAVT